MAEREPLDTDEIASTVPEHWVYDEDDEEIARTYEFDDYLDGVAFATEVGELAETEFHHPTIEIRYKEVEVRYTDHEAGGVSERDAEMAELTDERY